MNTHHPKNEPCYCGSGQLYKYCCINIEKRKNLLNIKIENKSDEQLKIDNFFNVALGQMAQQRIGLKNFCKNNDSYFFSFNLTISECDQLENLLKHNKLTFNHLINIYVEKIRKLGQDKILKIISSKSEQNKYYKSRSSIIEDAVKTHYLGFYSASIPLFIILIESILRELGQLDSKDKFKPTLNDDKIKNEPFYEIHDNIKYYNSYIHQLFEGNRNIDKFNRNTILHGFNINYQNEENSCLMLLTLLEISDILWWDDNLSNFKSFTN